MGPMWVVAVVVLAVALGVCEVARRRAVARAAAERRRLERALAGADSRASRLEAAFEALPTAVVLSGPSQTVLANRPARELLASAGSEALVQAAIREVAERALTTGAAERTVELYGPPPRVLEVTAVAVEDVVVTLVSDATERRRVDAVRRDFVANISHELRTPVGALALLAETILAEDDPAVVRRLSERMLAEAERVAAILEDLLELSRLEASPRADGHRPVRLAEVVAEAVDRVRHAADRRQVRLTVEGAGDVTVTGDPRQLTSAVANLCDNAVKYSPGGSEVRVGWEVTGSEVVVSVADRGIGIPAAELDRIFERFYRVDRARARDTGGSGLGLAIVRHVMANHRGRVTVTSAEGEGSVFRLHLPLDAGDPRTPAPTTADAPGRPDVRGSGPPGASRGRW